MMSKYYVLDYDNLRNESESRFIVHIPENTLKELTEDGIKVGDVIKTIDEYKEVVIRATLMKDVELNKLFLICHWATSNSYDRDVAEELETVKKLQETQNNGSKVVDNSKEKNKEDEILKESEEMAEKKLVEQKVNTQQSVQQSVQQEKKSVGQKQVK